MKATNAIRIIIVKDIVDPEKYSAAKGSHDLPYETVVEYIETSVEDVNRLINAKLGDTITFCPRFTSDCFRGELVHKLQERVFISEGNNEGTYITYGLIFKGAKQ